MWNAGPKFASMPIPQGALNSARNTMVVSTLTRRRASVSGSPRDIADDCMAATVTGLTGAEKQKVLAAPGYWRVSNLNIADILGHSPESKSRPVSVSAATGRLNHVAYSMATGVQCGPRGCRGWPGTARWRVAGMALWQMIDSAAAGSCLAARLSARRLWTACRLHTGMADLAHVPTLFRRLSLESRAGRRWALTRRVRELG